jgi:hypothetical protein
MKKTILTQRFQFYAIEPYKDYSTIESKVENQVHEDLNLELDNVDFFSPDVVRVANGEELERFLRSKFKIKLHNKKEYKKKNTKYFYSNESDGEMIKLDNWSNRIQTFYTTKERHLLKHYGRAFSSVSTEIHERNISIDGDTISVRFYVYRKARTVNSKYFKKNRSAFGFKINFRTGNVMSYEGVKTPKIRQNNFKHLMQVLMNFFSRTSGNIIHMWGGNSKDEHPLNLEAKKIFDDSEFMKCLSHSILSKLPYVETINSNDHTNIGAKVLSMIMRVFVEINKIKVPNHYEGLIMDAYPTKKFLKKNENKLIASILDRLGIKSKGTIKLLHKHPDIDIKKLILLARYFGYKNLHKYIHNVNEKFFINPKKKNNELMGGSIYEALTSKYEYDIKDSERKCLLKLINEFFSQDRLKYEENNVITLYENTQLMQLHTFNDHLDMLVKIRAQLPHIEMTASNLKDFHNEHLEFSSIDRAIRKGYSIKYVFEDRLIKHIEEPILIKDEHGNLTQTFYPVLLKIDGEYSEEGSHMHHCVASYADKERSIIVSVREGSPTGSERVTCEFDVRDKSCVQAKYFCNAVPPERFEFALEKTKHRVNIFRGSIKSTSKEKVPLVINGVQLEVKEPDVFGNLLELF